MDYITISIAIYNMSFKVFFTLTVFDILLILIKECVCDESSFSFSGISSQDGDDIQFPIPLAESRQSSESRYEISMSEDVIKKRRRGRPKGKLRTTVETTTMHSRFIVLPSVIVFKADEVFWPFRVETDIIGPFGLRQITSEATSKPGLIVGDWGGRELIDINGTLMKIYEHVEIVLRTFHKKGIKLGVMEQTRLGGKVIHLIKLFELDVFEFWHINEDSEIDHMKRIRLKADVNFRDIVYVGTHEATLEEMKNLGVIVFKLKLGEGLQLCHIGKIVHKFATRPYINTTESHDQIKMSSQEQPNSTVKTNQTVEEDYSADIDQFIFVKGSRSSQ